MIGLIRSKGKGKPDPVKLFWVTGPETSSTWSKEFISSTRFSSNCSYMAGLVIRGTSLLSSKSSIASSVDVFPPWKLSIRTRSSSAVGGVVYPDLGPFPYSISRSFSWR